MRIFRFLSNSIKKMSKKINYPAAERNKVHILEVLKKHLDPQKPGKILEIASGTGQHISYFALSFPNLSFQPSEYETSIFPSIKAYAAETPTKNVKNPIKIDVTTNFEQWNVGDNYDYLININMIHISPLECTDGLFKNGAGILKSMGLLITYGPYANNGVIEPQSNIDFDTNLKRSNSAWGLRDICNLKVKAREFGLKLMHIYDMPANNKCLVWQKVS